MLQKTVHALIIPAVLLLASNAQANTLLAYWNMDATDVPTKFVANQGTQAGSVSMTATPVGFLGDLGNDVGTTLNILAPEGDPNQALEFYTGASFFGDGQLEMHDFNFTGYTDVNFSVAVLTDAFIIWNSRLHLDYRINDGSWVDWAETETTNAGVYELESIALPDAIDGQANVDFRLRTSSWITLGGKADFDNIQITAVPEPGTWGLLAGASVLALLAVRRRK